MDFRRFSIQKSARIKVRGNYLISTGSTKYCVIKTTSHYNLLCDEISWKMGGGGLSDCKVVIMVTTVFGQQIEKRL